MDVKHIVDFIIQHNVEVIQWLVAIILATSALIIGISLFSKKTNNKSSDADLSAEEIKKTLKEVLEAAKAHGGMGAVAGLATNTAASSQGEVAVTSVVGDGSTASAVDVQRSLELTAKIEGLQKELASTEQVKKDYNSLQAKLDELQTKLSEYEILEDDIADLSLFKEENEKLKAQLKELGASIEAEKPLQPTKEDPPSPLPLPGEGKGDASVAGDFVAEFKAAVDSEKTKEVGASLDLAAEPEKPIEEPMVMAPASAVAKAESSPASLAAPVTESEDLMAEFEKSLSDTAGEPASADLDEVTLNTEKMLEEMASLAGLEGGNADVLQEEVDTDKMAEEATKFESGGTT